MENLNPKNLKLYDAVALYANIGRINPEPEKALLDYVAAGGGVVADQGGIFVQPALFEAFGLTVIESMTTGLPTFATCFGGPLEIIEDSVSGFHIDPNDGDAAAESPDAALSEAEKLFRS